MSKNKNINIGDKVVYRNKYTSDLYAIVEGKGEFGGLRCRLCEPITHIEVMPDQLELVDE